MADGLWLRLDVGDLWIHQDVNVDATAVGSVSFFVCGPVVACRQARPDFHQLGLMNRSPYKIAN